MNETLKSCLHGVNVFNWQTANEDFDAVVSVVDRVVASAGNQVGRSAFLVIRRASGSHALVEDSIGEIASAVRRYVLAGTSAQHRSEQVPVYRERVAALDTLEQIDLLTCESCGV